MLKVTVSEKEVTAVFTKEQYNGLLTRLVNKDLSSTDRHTMEWLYWVMAEEMGISDEHGNPK